MLKNNYWPDFSKTTDQVAALISIAFVLQIFISYPFWFATDRIYPVVPLIAGFTLSTGIDIFLFWIFITLLLFTAFTHFKIYTIPAIFLIYLLWVLQDIMRVQAWSYHYLTIFLLLFWAYLDREKASKVISLLCFVMITTYIWTGFHKINIHFAEVVFPWLMGIFQPFEHLGNIPALGYALAVAEMLLGIGLIWKKSRRITIYLITIFHLIILILLIKDGWNYVVYPWNLVMVFLVWSLFADKQQLLATFHSLKKWWLSYVIVFLYGIAPGLQPFNLWPYDMSQMMYTGLSTEMRFCFDEDALKKGTIQKCIPKQILRIVDPIGEKYWSLSMDDWTMSAYNLPTYPAEWYYKAVGANLCACSNTKQLFIEIKHKQRWNHQDSIITIPCDELK